MTNSRTNLRLKSSFTGTIYGHVKKLIFDGKLKPGQRVTIQEYAEYFNVSITPVREAFQRLLAEKYLLSNKLNRNELQVISLTSDEINQIFELCGALDIWGLKKHIAEFPEKVLSDLLAMHEVLRGHYEKKDIKAYYRQNYEIHSLIWKTTQNDFVYRTMISAQEKILIFIGLFPEKFYPPEVLSRSFTTHCELMDALRKKDIVGLESLLERHWHTGFFPDLDIEKESV